MIALRNNRKSRKMQLALECLDLRIVPATMSTSAALVAELRVETHHVQKWESALATAQPGSHHEKVLMDRIAGETGLMGRQEARLARIRTPAMARTPVAAPVRPHPILVSNTFTTSATPAAVTAAAIMAPASTTSTSSPTTTTTGSTNSTFISPPVVSPVVSPPVVSPPVVSPPVVSPPVSSPPTTNAGSQSPLPANVAQPLAVIYNAYEQDPSGFAASLPSGAGSVLIQGSNVGIQVQDGNPADFNGLLTELQNDGLQVTISSAQYGMIVGMLPIAQLPTIASLPQAPSITPELHPMLT